MSLQFLHRPYRPDSYPAQAATLAPGILATWLRHCPDAQPMDRDWEDWAENAIMLDQADRASNGAVQIILDNNRGRHVLGDDTPLVAGSPDAPRAFMFGLFKGMDSIEFPGDFRLVGNNAASVRTVQDYAKSPTFLAAAGRRFFVCDVEEDQLEAAMRALHDDGQRKAFVKTRFKGSATTLTLPDSNERLWWNATLDTDFGWFLISHEGAKGMLYVQEVFEPTKEYRTIILGDEAVTGAGCIELFTPLDSRGDAFDARVEPVRNRSEMIEDPETVARYREFADRYAKAWAAENGSDHAYSLDLAVDARTNEVVAIEMNPMMNLGLYATDATILMDAICRRFG